MILMFGWSSILSTFGHVEDLPREDWQSALRDLKPDVIYAQLNWQAVPVLITF
jgi:hypothetical protein